MSLNVESSELAPTFGWQMGATSSCINDIANDDFVPILQIESFTQDFNNSESGKHSNDVKNSNTFSVPIIQICESDNNNSNLLSLHDETTHLPLTREIRSSGSDVSLSFFLDSEQMSYVFDDNSFANVNSNISESKRNSMFDLDEES